MIGNAKCVSTSGAAKSYGMSTKPMEHGTFLFGKKAMAVWFFVAVVAAAVIVCMWPSSTEVGKDVETPRGKGMISAKKEARPIAARVPGNAAPTTASGAGDIKKQEARKDSGDVSGGKVVMAAMGREEEVQQALSESDLDSSVMEDLRDMFSQLAADDSTGECRSMRSRSSYKPSVVIAAANNILLYNGTSEEKEQALYAVGMLFGKEASTGVPYDITHPKNEIAVGDDGSRSVAPVAERPTQELISTVFAGLSDADESVRDAAFSVMRSLPEEESGVLAANILSGGDARLQERLMHEAGKESDVRLSLMGMGSESQSVRSLAAENLKNASGRVFASQQEASEWYEACHREFQQGAESQSPGMGEMIQQGQNK